MLQKHQQSSLSVKSLQGKEGDWGSDTTNEEQKYMAQEKKKGKKDAFKFPDLLYARVAREPYALSGVQRSDDDATLEIDVGLNHLTSFPFPAPEEKKGTHLYNWVTGAPRTGINPPTHRVRRAH